MNLINDALLVKLKTLLNLQANLKFYYTGGAAGENLSSFEVNHYMRKNDRNEEKYDKYELEIRSCILKLYKNGYSMEKLYQELSEFEIENDIIHAIPDIKSIKDGKIEYEETLDAPRRKI